jgi:hypothetical protein
MSVSFHPLSNSDSNLYTSFFLDTCIVFLLASFVVCMQLCMFLVFLFPFPVFLCFIVWLNMFPFFFSIE